MADDTTATVRQDEVASGVAFLKHPGTQQASLAQKLSFLEEKGLSQAEVTKVLQTWSASTEGGGHPPVAPVTLVPSLQTAAGLLGVAAAIGGVGGFFARGAWDGGKFVFVGSV